VTYRTRRNKVAEKTKLDSYTGLRGIAVLFVIIEHYSIWCAPFDMRTAPFGWIFGTGAMGMSVFFTLSGFVITYNYAGIDWGKRAAASFGYFAWLRFSRLYPAFLLFMTLVAIWPVTSQQLDGHYWSVTLLVASSLQSIYPFKFGGPIADLSYNISWSISTEIVFYVLFAVTMVALRKSQLRFGRWAGYVALAVAVLYLGVTAYLLWHSDVATDILAPLLSPSLSRDEIARWFFYVSPFVRFYDFVFGCFAAMAVRRGMRVDAVSNAAGALFVLLTVWACFNGRWLETQSISAPVLCAMMASGSQGTIVGRALSARWLVFVGTISYSLYLFHNIATHVVGNDNRGALTPTTFAEFIGLFALTLLVAIVIATGSYNVIEVPVQRYLRSLVGSRGK
jgi:peptidoglycan/LPS O-acetylase OafA/YrhL